MSEQSRQLIFCDVETGGLDPARHDLLTVALVDWQDGKIGDTVEFRILADPARVDASALAVNGIDLVSHNADALTRTQAAVDVARWCSARWLSGHRVRLAGHNVAFDVGFLRELLGEPIFRIAFHHRPVCTMSLLPYLWYAGRIQADVGRLGAACDALGVPMPPGAAHTALGDALAAARLYTAMLELAR